MRCLNRLILGLRRRDSGTSVAFSVSIGSGPFTTGATLTATVSGLAGGESVTYQWQDDGVNIGGATSSTYTAAIGTDSVADASAIRCAVTVDGGDPFNSSSRQIRYAAGSVTESAIADQTIDDDTWAVDFTGDFTTTNLTGSYVITGLSNGAVDDADGTISGGVSGSPATLSPVVTFTDQYGRTIVGNYSVDTVYRAQATGGADLDLAFVEGVGGSQDLLANWTTNGNTLTLASVSPSLAANVSISSSGTLTATSGVVTTADATHTLTMEDEYARPTDDTFTLEIAAAPSTRTIDSVSVGALSGDTIPISVVSLDAQNGDQVKWIVQGTGQTAPTATQVDAAQAGTGATLLDSGTLSWSGSTFNATLVANISRQNVDIYVVITEEGLSNVGSDTNFLLDTTAPALTTPTGTATSGTDASGSVTSDEANGTLYAGVWPTASTPSRADIKAGTGALYSTSGAPTAGVNNFSTTALTAGTAYKWHYYQEDDFLNESNVQSSAEFTTTVSSAMSSDINAVYWYAPDSVQHTAGVITSWDDKTANGFDLGQIASEPLPSYNTTNDYVEFDGTQIIGDESHPVADSLRNEVGANAGGIALFVVYEKDSSGQAASTAVVTGLLAEGTGGEFGNQALKLAHENSTVFDPQIARTKFSMRRFSNAVNLRTPSGSDAALGDALILSQHTANQTTATADVNDGAFTETETPTVANYPNGGDAGLFIGSFYSSGLVEPFTGNIREIFATTDDSAANVDAIRDELVLKYGV